MTRFTSVTSLRYVEVASTSRLCLTTTQTEHCDARRVHGLRAQLLVSVLRAVTVRTTAAAAAGLSAAVKVAESGTGAWLTQNATGAELRVCVWHPLV